MPSARPTSQGHKMKAHSLTTFIHESYTTAALDSQARQSRGSDDPPRKLPLQEKCARQKKLAG
eukprot:2141967-Amphidinium_carterae.1